MGSFGRQLAESAAAFRAVFRNTNLKHLHLAWAGSVVGHWAYAVAVSVYAFTADGTAAVGLVWLVRMVPAAFLSPFTAILADRFRREWVMLGSDLSRAALIAVAAAAVWLDGPPALVYALAALVAVIATPFRPAQAALIPRLATSPGEVTAANVAASSIESMGFFAGPALAGVLLIAASPATVFVVTAGLMVWSALFVSLIRAPRQEPEVAEVEGPAAPGIVGEALEGFRALAGDARLRLLVGLLAATTLVVGSLEVLVVVTAVELLDLGESGVGYLNSAFGVGALVGALVAAALVGVRRLSLPFVAGVLLWGLPVALIAAWEEPAVVIVLLGLVGVGNTLVDVAGFTLVQRTVPNEVLARVFGVIQFLWLGTIGVGAVIAPALVEWLGTRGALVATGCFLPALVAVAGLPLIRIDAAATAPLDEIALLRQTPIFAPLPGTTLEGLAARLIPLTFEPGTEIIRQGDPGDRFYLISEGEVEVSADGAHVAVLRRGEYFGEIALLRDVPRTATVTAKGAVSCYALERDDFLTAVTGYAPSARAAEQVVGTRLAALTAGRERLPVAGI